MKDFFFLNQALRELVSLIYTMIIVRNELIEYVVGNDIVLEVEWGWGEEGVQEVWEGE